MMSGGSELFVNQKNQQRRIMLWSKRYCSVSTMVKEILKTYSIPPGMMEHCDIDRRHDCGYIETYLLSLCLDGRREIPRMFIKNRHVASGHEILRLHETGELAEILRPITSLSKKE